MRPHRLLALFALTAPLAAQSPPLTFATETVDWPLPAQTPPTYAGADTAIAAGSFVAGHPGRSAVVLRGGQLYWSFQPMLFQSIKAVAMPVAGLGGGAVIGTLPAIAPGTDRLAVVHAGGLDVWRYQSPNQTLPNGGFVSVANGGPQNAFAGAVALRSGLHVGAGGEENHVLAIGPDWVQGAIVLPDETIVAGVKSYVAPGQVLLDATPVQWIAGGLPEIGVLTSTGMFVFNLAGGYVAGRAFPATTGKLTVTRAGGQQALCAAIDAGPDFVLRTWKIDGTITVSAAFPLPAPPTGLVTTDLDDDDQLDVVVSSTDSVLRCFRGSNNGPLGGQEQYDVAISDPAGLPADPAANLAAPTVDDIDYNGYPDLVLAHTAADQLTVMTSVKRQFQSIALMGPDPGDAKEPMGQPIGLFHAFEANWAFPELPAGAPLDGAGVRVSLPDWVTGDHVLRVIRYSAANGQVEMAALGAYDYPLSTSFAGKLFDVIVPVPPRPTGTAEIQEVFELMLVGVGAKAGDAATSALLDYRMSGDTVELSTWWQSVFNSYPLWGWQWLLAWAIDMGPPASQWNDPTWGPNVPRAIANPGGGQPPMETAARYIGLITAVDVVLSDEEPSIPAILQLGNGKVR